jgi:tetratricopeptide (TPR) repeat protein
MSRSTRNRNSHTWSALLLVLITCLLHGQQTVSRETDSATLKDYRFAEGLLQRRFYDLAEDEFRAFLAAHSDDPLAPRAAFQLVKCLQAQQKIEEALAVVSDFSDTWPESEYLPRLLLLQGDILLNSGRIEDAVRTLETVRAMQPDPLTAEGALYLLGSCYSAANRPEQALTAYSQLAELPFDEAHPYRPFAAFAAAGALEDAGRIDAAAVWYVKLLDNRAVVPVSLYEEALFRFAENEMRSGRYHSAREHYERLLETAPDSDFAEAACRHLAQAYLAVEQYQAALDLIRKRRATHPGRQDYRFDYLEGAALFGLDQNRAAAGLFDRVLHQPDADDQYLRLALYHSVMALLRLEQYPEALAMGMKFVEIYPHSPQLTDMLYFIGTVHYQMGDWQSASQWLQKAVDRFVGDWRFAADARQKLAESYRHLDNPKAAADIYRWLAKDSQAEAAAGFFLQAGNLAAQANLHNAALQDYEAALAAAPPGSDVASVAAAKGAGLHIQTEDYNQAATLLQTVINRQENVDTGLLLMLGFVHFHLQQFADAEQVLRQVMNSAGGSRLAEAKYLLAAVLLEQGKTEEGLQLFREILALAPDARPALDPDLLFHLCELYFSRNDYATSETLARTLASLPDADIHVKGKLRLAEILVARGRRDEAIEVLTSVTEQLAAGTDAKEPEAQKQQASAVSLLGELFLEMGRFDQAVREFNRAADFTAVDPRTSARINWGMAHILEAENRFDEALKYAVRAFVLGNERRYTPEAMLIAIRILTAKGRSDEALTTWQELRQRFPVYAEQHAEHTLIKSLMPQGTGPGE